MTHTRQEPSETFIIMKIMALCCLVFYPWFVARPAGIELWTRVARFMSAESSTLYHVRLLEFGVDTLHFGATHVFPLFPGRKMQFVQHFAAFLASLPLKKAIETLYGCHAITSRTELVIDAIPLLALLSVTYGVCRAALFELGKRAGPRDVVEIWAVRYDETTQEVKTTCQDAPPETQGILQLAAAFLKKYNAAFEGSSTFVILLACVYPIFAVYTELQMRWQASQAPQVSFEEDCFDDFSNAWGEAWYSSNVGIRLMCRGAKFADAYGMLNKRYEKGT